MMSLNSLFKVAATVVVAGLLLGEAVAADPKSEADTIAEAFLKAGSKLFDAEDAAGLAATYTEDAQILLVTKRDGQIQNEGRRGRADIEELYRSVFQAVDEPDSENTIEHAHLISPEVLVVHGRFRAKPGMAEFPFVQLREKRGDRWLLSRLWLFLNPES
jgi:ketosteroid isomerase-like protein